MYLLKLLPLNQGVRTGRSKGLIYTSLEQNHETYQIEWHEELNKYFRAPRGTFKTFNFVEIL